MTFAVTTGRCWCNCTQLRNATTTGSKGLNLIDEMAARAASELTDGSTTFSAVCPRA